MGNTLSKYFPAKWEYNDPETDGFRRRALPYAKRFARERNKSGLEKRR
jgi:hypothetical protein